MSAHGWSKRFRFPGYDGAMPKSLRSLRGRGKYQHKVNKAPSDWGLFELLATVAGQVLQEKKLNEDNLKRQIDCTKDQEKATENEEVSQAAINNVQHPQAGFCGKPSDCSYNSKNVQDMEITSTAYKKTNTKEGFGYAESVEEALNPCTYMPCIDLAEESNILGNREKCTNSFEAGVLDSRHTVWKGTNLALSEPDHQDVVVHRKGRKKCERLRSEEGSCMTLGHRSVLSCNSIEEDLTSVHTIPCKFVNNKASKNNVDSRQKLVSNTPKDDDDNLSVSIPLKECSSNGSSQKLLVKDLRQEELLHGSVKMETPIGSKRKYFQAMTKDASMGSSPLSNRKVAWEGPKSGSSPVKVNITSFTVPELCVNLPKTATVGNLKRAVMDAAINKLGGGLNVRVLHQGKKISDESTTLIQMGICSHERPDSLAFMLEPDRFADTTMHIEEPLFGLSKASNKSAAWYPIFASREDKGEKKDGILNEEPCAYAAMDVKHNLEGTQAQSTRAMEPDRNIEPYQYTSGNTPMILCRPLILHPALKDMEALDIVRAQQSFQQMSSGKRRVRRPFSVIEVSALVQAVELLGTGRWREVKQQAFDHARHRTYVDLKDKWKTLVHTAHIAPHQRRGEPVPQELLDRVLKAHSYWAAQQSKQQAVPGM